MVEEAFELFATGLYAKQELRKMMWKKGLKINKSQFTAKIKKQYETLNEATPLRGLITCSRCGGKLTSSASKGRKKYYTYYHCRNGCPERIPAETAHNALTNYLNDLAVKPEIQLLFLKIRENVCKENSIKHQEQVNKVAAELKWRTLKRTT